MSYPYKHRHQAAGESPYREIRPDYGGCPHVQTRWAKTIEFLNGSLPKAGVGLDIGDRYGLTEMCENHFGIEFENTGLNGTDLDVDPLEGQYDIITCFEILEHLFNPLHCLLEMKKVLAEGGRIYISTPRHRPSYIWGHHFHEMSARSINALFTRAGLSVVRKDLICIAPWRNCLTGFRPWLRMLIDRTMLFELIEEDI